MSQLDLEITEVRRTRVKGMLTPHTKDRIRNEESSQDMTRERGRTNALLAINIDTLIREKKKSTST